MFRCKKLLFMLLSFFIGLSFPHALTLTTDYQSNYFSNRIINGVNYSGPLAYMYIDNNIVYCLNPEVIVGTDYHLNQGYLSHYVYEQLEFLQLLAYYGYSDVNHTLNYYTATQELIWETLTMNSNFYWSTERNLGGSLIDVSREKNEIYSNVLSFYEGVSFRNETYYGYVGDELVIKDKNNVLENYIVDEGSKNHAYIENNKLHVKVSNVGLEEIKLIRRINNRVNTEVYSSSGHQNLIRLGINVYTENYVKIKGFENPDISPGPVPPNEEPETPIDLDPPHEELEIPINPDPPNEELEIPINPDPPNEELEIPAEPDIILPEDPVAPIEPDIPEEPIYDNPLVEDNTPILEDKLPNTYNSEKIYYIIFGINLILGIGVYNKRL